MDTPLATPNTPTPDSSLKVEEEKSEMPKKYIRTFEGDIAALKNGSTPDLTPLRPEVAPAAPSVRQEGSFVEVKPSPLDAPEPAPIPLETYAGDFSDRMKEMNASAATVLAAEQDAGPIKSQEEPRSSRRDLFYILVGVLLLVAGGFGAYFVYVYYSATPAPVVSAPVVSLPIFVDEKEQVSGVGTALLSAIEQSVARPLASGTIRLLSTENATSTDTSIFSSLQIPAPDILLRNVDASNSMAGVIHSDGKQSPFFILSVVSYGDTFSGMLSWEPLMTRDLGALFPPYAAPVVGTTVVASTTIQTVSATTTTTTSSTTKKVVTKTATSSTSSLQATTTATSSVPVIVAGFRDEVINNLDVHVYRDTENRSILLYGYWNQSTLIIARDPAAFTELVRRLTSSHAQ